MRELQAEYEVLRNTHHLLVEERTQLHRELADGAAFAGSRPQDASLSGCTRHVRNVVALAARRQELQLKRSGGRV